MYDIHLTESLFPAQQDGEVWETTVTDLLRKTAAELPAAPALVEVTESGVTARRWTYGELLADSEALALALASRFAPGEHITVWGPNMPEWLLVEYACSLAGLVLVTANPAYQGNELRYVLEQSGSVALFLVQSYRGNPMAEIGAGAAAGLASIREIVDLEDHAALYRTGDRSAELPTVQPGDAAQIQYTSGTTGFPKGAVLSHRGLLNNARFFAGRCGADQQSVWINVMPMFHTSGCAMIALGCLQAASRMVLVRVFDPAAVIRLIEQERATMMLGVPTMLVGLLGAYSVAPGNVSSLELVVSGGSMVAPELVRNVSDVFACDFITLYGQTEASPVVTQQHRGIDFDDVCNTIGQPLPQADVSIRDIATNKVMAVDEVGEICVRGYCTMIGYHDNDEATAEAIDEDGWLHTGDLGRMDFRGFVRITGRVKEMIIRGGENHFPVEIENVLLEHPAVTEVAVVGLPDPKWGEIIACFIRSEGNLALDIADLRQHCRKSMSPQKTPVVWCRVTDFPLTGSGKIQKFMLRDGYLDGTYAAES